MQDNDIMTTEEAAEFLKLTSFTVRDYARRGTIPARKVGKGWRFYKPDLVTWLRGKRGCMRLRDKLKSFWPPEWSGSYGEGTEFLIGEPQGLVLKSVQLKGGPPRIEISVKFDGESCMAFYYKEVLEAYIPDDPELFSRLYDRLKQSVGKEIHEIGDLEI
jgi:excisionase family DNA binding protein